MPVGAQTRMLRSPSVSARHVAFTYASNVWVVDRQLCGANADAKSCVARRLTSFAGETSNPRLSPDGALVAFSAEYGGNVDVYVVPVEGGEPRRLTWHPSADQVQGWSADGKQVLFASGRATSAPNPVPRFWQVPLAGGIETPLPLPRAYQGRLSPDGRRVAYRMNTSWDEERRNYRGGQNKAIWITDLGSLETVTPPFEGSKDMDPVWVNDAVWFISDRDGVANVWAYAPGTKQLRQVTSFRDFDVKTLDAGSGTAGAVVFEQGGRIHELDVASGKSRVLPITAAGDFPWMMPRWEDVTNRMTNLALSPGGRRAAVEARGEIFTIPAEKGDVRNLTNTSASAEKAPAWSPDGRFVSYFSDRSGEYKLYIAPQDGLTPPREIAIPEPVQYYTPSWSPDGKRLLFHDTHFRVWVTDVESGQSKIVGNDPWLVPERTINPTWSPDGNWIAYATRLPTLFHAIRVYNVATGETRQVTDGLADATWPVWDASGKYLWFLASTNYGLASQWLDMTSYDRPVTRALYMAVLQRSEPNPFPPESDEEAAQAGAAPRQPGQPPSMPPADSAPRRGASAAAGSGAMPAGGRDTLPARSTRPVRIDFDGLARRVVAVPGIALRGYTQLRAGAPGTVFMIEDVPATGTAAAGPQGGALHRFSLRERKATPFATNVAQYVVSGDGKKLLYRTAGAGGPGGGGQAGAGGQLFLVDADKAPPQAGTGRLAAQLRMYLEPRREFAQIFAEGWRNQRDYLYVQNMHGADWPAMRKMYEPMLQHVNHRADLNYLLDQMGGEIAIGHSYVRGGDMPQVAPSQAGLLGADLAVENGRYRIARIYDAESWNPELRAPLAGPGSTAKVGDYIVAINGVEVVASDNIHRLLDGTANRQTVLALNTRPALEGARRETVIPVANEQGLRARAWVEANRRKVDSLSGGKLAYVHVPNTGNPGYTSFNRYYFAQQDKLGAIIDERFNGGGSAADYIIEVLQRDFDGYFNNAVGDRTPFTAPSAGIWGPKVMIINEMAGSGGDYMPFMFKRRNIGPLVGTRTWGGLVHTADTPPFVDGGSMIAPRGGFFTREGKWAVENEGVGADIEVENWPKEVAAGHDPQLERAVSEAMRMLKEKPVERMTKEPPPPTWGRRQQPIAGTP